MTLRALLSHWKRNPLQLFTFLSGLALATALWSGVQAINAEARASYDAAAATLGEGQFDHIVARDGGAIDQDIFVALRRAGWLVSPITEGRLDDVTLVGVDPLTAPGGLPDLNLNADAPLQDFLSDGVLFASEDTASRLERLGLADTVTIRRAPGVAPGIALGDIGLVQSLLERNDLDRLTVATDQPMRRAELDDMFPTLTLRASLQRSDLGQMTDSFHLNLTAFGLLSFAVGLFIVHSVIGLAFEQRRSMLRTLRALGVPLRHLVMLVALEMLILAFAGAVLGIILGYLIAAALLPDVAATLRGLYDANVTDTLRLRPEWWASGLAVALLGTIFAVTGKLWQVARMPLLASARPRAWVHANANTQRIMGALAVVCLITALALLYFGEGLLAGFALQGFLLVGAALAMPVALTAILEMFRRRSQSVVPHWFWADTRQQMPGLSLALMALLLAVSANIGVTTMVASFRLTFVDFLDQRLASELYVNVADPSQSAAVEASLLANADEVMPLIGRPAVASGMPVDLDGIRVGETYRQNWQFLDATPDFWNRLTQGEALIVNEQLARRAGLWLDDTLSIEGQAPLPIVAIMADYGNPRGQIVVDEKLYAELTPGAVAQRFGARTSDVAALTRQIQRDTGLPDAAFIDQAEIKAFSLRVFERTFAITAALNILTLSVASFALLMSLLTLADLRIPQLAPVWATGLTRRTLGRMEFLRALALAACVFVLSLPLGLALAWTLLAVVNVEAFGWRLPMYLFPGDYAVLGVLAFCAAGLAALWPSLRLARISPSRLLKVFANDG